ncbi:MAG: transposase, partial [Solobacterium sp.]|nr:transposase [Solobacterium sp.]
MLKHISSIWEFRDFLKSEEINLVCAQRKRLSSKLYRSALHKLKKLDPALASDLLFSLYSNTGRPAIDPSLLIRSFILMQHLGYTSITRWCDDLLCDSLLQYLIGSLSPPSMASHYDFIIRLTGVDPHMDVLYSKDHYKKPPKQKPKHGEKLKNYSHTDTYYLLD